jgi:hypothetical protein
MGLHAAVSIPCHGLDVPVQDSGWLGPASTSGAESTSGTFRSVAPASGIPVAADSLPPSLPPVVASSDIVELSTCESIEPSALPAGTWLLIDPEHPSASWTDAAMRVRPVIKVPASALRRR